MKTRTAPSITARKRAGVVTRLAGGYLLLIAMIMLVAAIGITNIGKIRSAYDQVPWRCWGCCTSGG